MAIRFQDRIVQYPNRVKLTPVAGQANTYDVSRVEGNVTAEGTALNRENLEKGFLSLSRGGYLDDGQGRKVAIFPDWIGMKVNSQEVVSLDEDGLCLNLAYTISATSSSSGATLRFNPQSLYANNSLDFGLFEINYGEVTPVVEVRNKSSQFKFSDSYTDWLVKGSSGITMSVANSSSAFSQNLTFKGRPVALSTKPAFNVSFDALNSMDMAFLNINTIDDGKQRNRLNIAARKGVAGASPQDTISFTAITQSLSKEIAFIQHSELYLRDAKTFKYSPVSTSTWYLDDILGSHAYSAFSNGSNMTVCNRYFTRAELFFKTGCSVTILSGVNNTEWSKTYNNSGMLHIETQDRSVFIVDPYSHGCDVVTTGNSSIRLMVKTVATSGANVLARIWN